jgi:hypothetical protein
MKIRVWVVAGSIVLTIVGIGAVGVIVGPALLAQTSPVEAKHYASWDDAPSREDDPPASRPDWAPADAHGIELEYRVRNVPGYTLSMLSATGVDFSACTRLHDDHGGAAMASHLLPSTMPDRPWTCGDGRAVWQDGDHVWAWSTNKPITVSR